MHFVKYSILYDYKIEYLTVKCLLKQFHVHINALVVTKSPLRLNKTPTLAGIIRRAAAATLWHRLVGRGDRA